MMHATRYSPVEIQNNVTVNRSSFLILIFTIMCVISVTVLLEFRESPDFAILLTDLCFCTFCTMAFTQKWRVLFLLHPAVLFLLKSFYQVSFLTLGDGEAYYKIVTSTLPFYTGEGNFFLFLQDSIINQSIYVVLKSLSLGIFPVFLIPDYLYNTVDSTVYYIWQSTFFVILVSLCVLLAKKWAIVRDDYLYAMSLFVVISPSFLELGCAPTRHYVTFIGLWLFYISFMAVFKKANFFKIVWLLVSILVIAISKIAYFGLIILFVYCYLLLQNRRQYHVTWLILIGLLVLTWAFLPFFVELAQYYSRYMANNGGGELSFLIMLPVVGIVMKYTYAIFSPFPWKNAFLYIETLYGGNPFFFVLHMLSALTGLYLILRLILYAKPLWLEYPDIRASFLFGGILSISILFGGTGFHSYLVVLFPFFVPLFMMKKYTISLLFPVFLAVLAEILHTLTTL